ncbi:MAG: hypothetical protein N3G80_02335 [Candidatus Micrarchaeota archaeon]|nr:hypothetical protein [Candidatus Micrarchaeota archaeon]
MFIFQMQMHKKKENEEQTSMQRQFLQSAFPEIIPISDSKDAESLMSIVERSFKKHGIADFLSTLTPGTQNAIYAASFVWGYENAARYVKNAMKLSEVQSAKTVEEKSKALIESVQKQAAQEKETDISHVIWSFYNEDMKESQIESARSQTFFEKHKQQQELLIPQDGQQAVVSGILQNSLSPLLLYCASSQQHAESEKKEEFAKLFMPQPAVQLQVKTPQEKEETESEQLVIKNKEEVLQQLKITEEQLKQAQMLIEKVEKDNQSRLKEILQKHLPPLLYLELFGQSKALRKLAVKKQLQKWLAFCSSAQKQLSIFPAGKLIKLALLSKLFR